MATGAVPVEDRSDVALVAAIVGAEQRQGQQARREQRERAHGRKLAAFYAAFVRALVRKRRRVPKDPPYKTMEQGNDGGSQRTRPTKRWSKENDGGSKRTR